MAEHAQATDAPTHAEHFESLAKQSHAAHLGMWVFLASEVLLFAGLFALYASYRARFPGAFAEGIEHGTKLLGSINTAVLLCSSYAVASSVLALRKNRRGLALALLAVTIVLAGAFLVIKFTEYREHFSEGIYPGGRGHFFVVHQTQGLAMFFTMYFVTTGLHAFHVCVGMLVLLWLIVQILRGKVAPPADHPLALGAMYWHLVDVIWIFVWPLYYLAGGA